MADKLSFFDNIKQTTERNNFWYRLAVGAGAVLISALVAYIFTSGGGGLSELLNNKLLLAIPGAAAAAYFLFHLELGLLALVVASLVVPFSIGTGTQTSLNIAILLSGLLIGLWVFDMVARRREIRLVPSKTLAPLAVFAVVTVLAFLSGQLPWFYFAEQASLTAQIGQVAVFLLSAGVFLLVGNQIRDLIWIKLFSWAYLLIGGLYVLLLLVPGVDQFASYVVLHGVQSNGVFWVWLIALAFSQAVYNDHLPAGWRAALGLLVLGGLYVVLVQRSGWASGWVPSVVAITAILLVSLSRWTWAAVAAGLVLVFTKLDEVRSLLFAGDNEYSLVTRLEAWRILGEMVKSDPVLGLGPANYYRYTPLYSILGYNVEFNSHNNYIDLVAQLGLAGLGAFLWLAGAIAWVGWWLRNRVPAGFAQAYVYGALGGLAGMLVAMMLGDWVLPFIYNVGLNGFRASLLSWLFLGGLVALEGMVMRGQFTSLENPEEDR